MFSKILLCSLVLTALISIALTGTQAENCKEGASTCINIEECTGLYNQVKDDITPRMSQLLRDLHCGYDTEFKARVCCSAEYKQSEAPKLAVKSAASHPLLPSTEGCSACGIQTEVRTTADKFVLAEAKPNEHPWLAIIKTDSPGGCIGVLISQRYVLTTSRCVGFLPANWKLEVVLGEYNKATKDDCLANDDCSLPPQTIPVEETIIHEGFKGEKIHFDIALLRLARKVWYTDFVKPICLPLSDDLKTTTYQDLDLEVSGWIPESDVKLKERVPVVNLTECKVAFKSFKVNDKQLCTGGSGYETPLEAPLVGKVSPGGNWVVLGMDSFGFASLYRVHVRVTSYIDWILSKMHA